MRVRFVYARRRYAIMAKMRHGLANLNPNNSVLQQTRIVYSNFIQGTMLIISLNGLGNKTVIPCLFSYRQTITPRYRGRPDALLHSAFGPVQQCIRSSTAPRDNRFDYTTNRHEITIMCEEQRLNICTISAKLSH